MLRMLSSALDDLREKFSHASKRIADGEVDPGRKTEADDAAEVLVPRTDATWRRETYLALSVRSHKCLDQ